MKFTAKVVWKKYPSESFVDKKYSRKHTWNFDGGAVINASSSPLSVPVPMSDATAVDPEEALVAAVSSCHMLFFLSIAAANNLVVSQYEDEAEGIMKKDSAGLLTMTQVTLRPMVIFTADKQPLAQQVNEMHKQAHAQCYIANSIKSTIIISE